MTLECEHEIRLLEEEMINSVLCIDKKEQLSQETRADDDENASVLNEIESKIKEITSLRCQLENTLIPVKSMSSKYEKMQEAVTKIKNFCDEIRSCLEMKDTDKGRMTKARDMFKIAKDFTGIRWNYSSPNNIISGYIANKDKVTLEPFEFDKSVFSEDKIPAEMWKRIEASSTVDWSDLVTACEEHAVINKENVCKN